MKKFIIFFFMFFAPLAINIFSSNALIVNHGGDGSIRDGDGQCPLREALFIVQHDRDSLDCQKLISGIGTIYIEVPEIAIDSLSPHSSDESGGDFDVILLNSDTLTIKGNLPTRTSITIDEEVQERIFEVYGIINDIQKNVIFENLEIHGGYEDSDLGGGIKNKRGNVTLQNSIVKNNKAAGGGGIYNFQGNLILSNSWISNNETLGTGGFAQRGNGGGILSSSESIGGSSGFTSGLTIKNSFITNNTANFAGGGIDISGGYSFEGSIGSGAIIRNSYIGSNLVKTRETGGFGGGISMLDSSLKIYNSTIEFNKSEKRSGGLDSTGYSSVEILNNSKITNNHSSDSAGGFYCGEDCTMIISDSKINNNFSNEAGGFYNISQIAPVTIKNSEISSNTSQTNGGALYNRGSVIIDESIIFNNFAKNAGAAFYNYGGKLEVTTSEISHNGLEILYDEESNITENGGVIANYDNWSRDGSNSKITNSTIAHNYAKSGSIFENQNNSKIFVDYSTLAYNYKGSINPSVYNEKNGTISFFASILALNGPQNCKTTNTLFAAHTFIFKNGGGRDRSCNLSATSLNNFIDVNPKFDGDLKNNSGNTRTIALQPSSKAINHASSDSSCISRTNGTDQRLITRFTGQCDSGAFEYTESLN